MAKKQIKNYVFEPGISKDANLYPKAVALLTANKAFIIAQELAFIDYNIANNIGVYSGYKYAPEKCRRDVGYYLDTIIHDLRYGGNARVRMVAEYFWINGNPQIRNGAVPEVTAQQYMRDLINNYIFTNTTAPGTYNQNTVQQVKYVGNNAEAGAAGRNSTLWNIYGTVIQQGLSQLPAKQTGVTTIRLLGNYDSSEVLLITDANNGNILYNFSDNATSSAFIYKQGNSSGDGRPLSDVDFEYWHQTTDTITTIELSVDTTMLTAGSPIQVFVEEPSQQIRPWDFGTDAIERMRVAAPQAMLDADFEYGLQPTKWQALALQRSYPSLYEIPGTDVAIAAVTTDASTSSGGFGASLITVQSIGTHGFSVGTPITIRGLNGAVQGFSRAEGSYIIYSVPTPYTFTYYSSSKVGTTLGDSLFTSYLTVRQAGFYTGASIGSPTFTVASNGSVGTLTTVFQVEAGDTFLVFSGTAPTTGAPVTGSPAIYPGTSVSGVVGSSSVNVRLLSSTVSGQTYLDIVDLTGVLQGMGVASGGNSVQFISSIQGNRINLDGGYNQVKIGASQTYLNIAGTNVNSIGTSARFDIRRIGGNYTVTGRVDSTSNGQNYARGDQIKIAGNLLGGATPANDLIISLTAVDSGGTITNFTYSGTAFDGGGTYTGLIQYQTTGSGFGATIDVVRLGAVGAGNYGVYNSITLTNPGSGYVVGEVITWGGDLLGGTKPANDLGITVASVNPSTGAIVDYEVNTANAFSGNADYSGIAGTNVTPTGSGGRFDVSRSPSGYAVTLNGTGGVGYVLGNRIRITGTQVNGVSPLNDCIIEILTVDVTGAITSVTATGTGYLGDQITIYPSLTLSDPTIAVLPAATVLNVGAIATIQVDFVNNHGLVPGAAILTNITSTPTPGFNSASAALPASATWTGVAQVAGRFVAVNGNGGTTGFSINGTTWTSGGNLPSGPTGWAGVAGGTIGATTYFMAVPNSSSNVGAVSNNGGVSWSSITLPATATWKSITFYSGVFVAIATSSNVTAYSINGTAWVLGGVLSATTTWVSVIGGLVGTLAYYIAVASGGTAANYSYDGGVTWVATGVLPASQNWSAVAFGNSSFLAIANGSATAAISTNGTTWTSVTLPSSAAWSCLTYGDDNFLAVASGTTTAITSFTGATGSWATRTLAGSSSSWASASFYSYAGLGIFPIVGNGTAAVAANLISGNHALASGPFIVSSVPSLTQIRYPARTTGSVDASVTPITGVVYSRPDAFFQHRPFDGGVQLGTGGPQHGAQAVRQSKKYIRYQSGKGIMYTTGALFAPSYNLASATANATTTNSIITFSTDDTDHGLQPGGVVEITGMASFEYNNTYTVESVNSSRSFRVRTSIPLNSATGTLGPDAKVTVKAWHGATVRSGPFDDQNGIFYQFDGQTLGLGKRSSTFQLAGTVNVAPNANVVTGTSTRFQDQLKVGDKIVLRGMSHTVTSITSQTALTFAPDYRGNSSAIGAKLCLTQDFVVPQGQWNMDNGDGTGPSGYNINPGKMQMIGIQYSWYAAGFIEFMLRGADGKFVFLHRIRNSNVNTEAYMRTANLPVRYEVQNESGRTALRASMGTTDTFMTLFNTSGFPTSGTVYVDNELIAFTGKTADRLTGLTRAATFTNFAAGSNRTYSAGPAASHAVNAGVILISCTISPAISHWGSAILTDGMFDDDRGYLFNYASTNINVSTTKTTAFMIRLAPSVSNAIVGDLGDRELLNRAQLLLQQIAITSDALVGGAIGGLVVEGVLNPQNYPADPSTVQWTSLSGVSQGGQPSFAQIAPGGNVSWAGGGTQTTATASTATGSTQVRTNFLYFKQSSWDASQAKVGTEVQDYAKFPAGTRVSNVVGPSNYIGTSAGNEYQVFFTQNSIATIAGDTNVTFLFGQPPYALPGEQVFSFIANAGDQTSLDLGSLKELTSTSIGGRGTYPNGPDVLAINVYKVSGTATAANIILRWSEAQA